MVTKKSDKSVPGYLNHFVFEYLNNERAPAFLQNGLDIHQYHSISFKNNRKLINIVNLPNKFRKMVDIYQVYRQTLMGGAKLAFIYQLIYHYNEANKVVSTKQCLLKCVI